MNTNKIPEQVYALGLLIVWGGALLTFGVLRLDAYGLDENAARGLLLNWSISDQIISPVLVLGVPDFRALLFAPIGIYWSGSILAAKIFSLIISFIAIYLLYKWCEKQGRQEAGLVAGALLLISPTFISQIDTMGAAPYLLLGFGLGAWLDNAYRSRNKDFGGWYFLQLLWIAILVTLHPIGLAYPIALAIWWKTNPDKVKNSRHIYVGILISALLATAIKMGWQDLSWFANPIEQLALALQGKTIWSTEDIFWFPGFIATVLLIIIVLIDYKILTKDLLGIMLIVALFLGLFVADSVWATIAITIIIFRGLTILIDFQQSKTRSSFIGQRGLFIIIAFLISTFFMFEAKTHALTIKYEILSPEDELIHALAEIAKDENKPFRAASQWPGRTVIATKRDVLPLPPGFESPEAFWENAGKNLTHIIFNPKAPENQELTANLANLVGKTNTLALIKGGALIKLIDHEVKLFIRPDEEIIEEKTASTNQQSNTEETSNPSLK